MKTTRIFVSLMMILFITICTTDVNASTLEVGGSSNEEYQATGNCAHGDRGSCEILVDKFIDEITYVPLFGNAVATKLFQYEDNNAWSQDMLDGSFSNDSIDDVDFMIFSGHGYGKGLHGIANNSLHYYTLNSTTNYHASGDSGEIANAANVTTVEADWGKSGTDTKWVATFSCNFVNTSDSSYNTMMQGIHIYMGFGSVMWVDSREGALFGKELRNGNNIIDSFLDGVSKYQSGKCTNPVIAKTIYADISRNDTILNYSAKPSSIQSGTTTYYSITRTVPSI